MKFIEYAEKLETLKYLIKYRRAGTPLVLAKKLNVSIRTIQRMMQQLREQGHRIIFNRVRGSYEVESSGECNKKT
jgi:predicted DNA-binding transcriptional regulator YafY